MSDVSCRVNSRTFGAELENQKAAVVLSGSQRCCGRHSRDVGELPPALRASVLLVVEPMTARDP